MRYYHFLFLYISLSFFSCNELEKIQKNKDSEYKLQKANEFYDKKQYSKANTLYEELLTLYKGTNKFEPLYYKYAMSFYLDKSYMAASYHFKNFADMFPKAKKAEEANYLHARCLYLLSPDYTLDQTNTLKSIGQLQTFINDYPVSDKVKDANGMIDNSRYQLEEKSKYAAELYYKISQYKSASIYFEETLNNFPDSKHIDYYQLMTVKANYEYAKNSVETKQKERFNLVLEKIKDYEASNPKNMYQNEINGIKNLSLQVLKKL